jgi:hypothetical protein
MTVNVFGGGVDDDISPEGEWPLDKRGGKSIICYQSRAVRVGEFCQLGQVRNP